MANSYWQGTPDEESRQHYATVRIQEFRRYAFQPISFEILLTLFRQFGDEYDNGSRLRDFMEGAA